MNGESNYGQFQKSYVMKLLLIVLVVATRCVFLMKTSVTI